MKHEAYFVLWVDSQSHEGGWHSIEEDVDLEFRHMPAIGFLIKQNKKGIALAVSPDDDSGDAISILEIPKCAIVYMEKIKLKKRSKKSGS